MDKSTLALALDEDSTLIATVLPKEATDNNVTWTSNANAIASVYDGKVTAISEGKATITAQAGDQTAICEITVIDGVIINEIIWATRNVDAPGTFAAKPEAPGMFYQWNRKVGWSASDPMINHNGEVEWDTSTPTGDT